MANIETQPQVVVHEHEPTVDRKKIEMKRKTSIGGVALETLAAVTAVVLAIIGLADLYPLDMAGIAAIACGVALLFEGLSVGTQLHPGSASILPRDATTGEIGVEAIAGLGGITLGILAIARVVPSILLPVASLVLGVGLLFATHPLSEIRSTYANETYDRHDRREEVIHGATRASSGVHALAGIAAIVLGIIALVTQSSIVSFALVSFLVVGATILLASAAIGGRLMARFQHW